MTYDDVVKCFEVYGILSVPEVQVKLNINYKEARKLIRDLEANNVIQKLDALNYRYRFKCAPIFYKEVLYNCIINNDFSEERIVKEYLMNKDKAHKIMEWVLLNGIVKDKDWKDRVISKEEFIKKFDIEFPEKEFEKLFDIEKIKEEFFISLFGTEENDDIEHYTRTLGTWINEYGLKSINLIKGYAKMCYDKMHNTKQHKNAKLYEKIVTIMSNIDDETFEKMKKYLEDETE